MSAESLRSLASKVGLAIPEKNVNDFRTLLAGVDQAAKLVLESEGRTMNNISFYFVRLLTFFEDYIPKVDLDLYPRTDYHIPEDTDKGGWASKVSGTTSSSLPHH